MVRDQARLASSWSRALPDFMIIGAQKAGTTSLFNYLAQYPDIHSGAKKEVHFFDHWYDHGERWYRSQFPPTLPLGGRTWLTGEASPYYLLHPAVPARVACMLPEVRLVALLRQPVARAYSHFQHSRAAGKEPLQSFEEALRLEGERTDEAWRALELRGGREPAVEFFSYARRSRYAPQLRRWLDAVPAESLLVIIAEDLFHDPKAVLQQVRSHLRLPPSDVPIDLGPRNVRGYEALPEGVRRRLGELFAEDVAEVEKVLGRRTGWQL